MKHRIIRLRQDGTQGQTQSLFQESSAASRQTQSDLKDLEVLTLMSKLTKGTLELAMITSSR